MKVIGITGGVGAGKSTILEMLQKLCDCLIIKADDVAKQLMLTNKDVRQYMEQLFGEETYLLDGSINTNYIGKKIFSDPRTKKKWEDKIHPIVKQNILNLIDIEKQNNKSSFVFIEAALLLENKYDLICDEIWYVYASEEERIYRLTKDREYSLEKIHGIFENQMQASEFRKYSNFIIDTSIDLEYTQQQLENKLDEYNPL